MAGDARVATGATIAFATSGFEANIKLESISFGGVERAAIATPHLGLTDPGTGKIGNVPKIMSAIVDAGTMSMDVFWDPDVDLNDVMHAAKETITITWPKTSGQTTAGTWSFTGAVTKWNGDAPMDDKMGASIEVTIDGSLTITAGA